MFVTCLCSDMEHNFQCSNLYFPTIQFLTKYRCNKTRIRKKLHLPFSGSNSSGTSVSWELLQLSLSGSANRVVKYNALECNKPVQFKDSVRMISYVYMMK